MPLNLRINVKKQANKKKTSFKNKNQAMNIQTYTHFQIEFDEMNQFSSEGPKRKYKL